MIVVQLLRYKKPQKGEFPLDGLSQPTDRPLTDTLPATSPLIMPSLGKAATAALGAGLALRQSTDTSSLGIKTPIMGYNTYNDVGCTPTESHTNQMIDAMVSQGFRDAGYKFFQIDCGWQGTTRGTNNTLNAIDTDPEAYPNGIPPISQKARDNGLIFSMYSDAGQRSCDTRLPPTRVGSDGYEEADAKQFAEWNVEYVKYDYCWVDGTDPEDNAPKAPRTDFVDRYSKMWNALKAVNIPRMLICQWGTPYNNNGALQGPVEWSNPVSTSFRLSDDISNAWEAVTRIINQSIYLAREDKVGPDHFADADLLEVGNGALSLDEQKAHFAYWAMAKSALMISTNMANVNGDSKAILLNSDLIAINQDSLGKPVVLVQRYTGDRDLFRGPLANGDEAVLLLNSKNEANNLAVDLASELGIDRADIKDLYTGETLTGQSGSFTRNNIGAHGAVALRLSNIQRAQSSNDNVAWVEAESGSGGSPADCGACSGGRKVGNIGDNGTLTISGVQASGESATVLFDYVNAEVGYLAGQGQNARSAHISVNGGSPQTVAFPLSGYDWSLSVAKNFRVDLTGFRAGSDNTIAISTATAGYFAPDVDRVGVIQ